MPLYAQRIWILLGFLGSSFGCVSWELPDLDGDGSGVAEDCDVLDPNIGPEQEEIWYDGIDQNCDGNDDDQDGDGFVSVDSPTGEGDDCWDDPTTIPEAYLAVEGYEQLDAASVHPEAEDSWYDGVDSDCAENSDFDQDGDGYDSAHHNLQDGSIAGDDCVDGPDTNFYLEEFPDEWSVWTNNGFGESDINPGVADDECHDGINADCDDTSANVANENPEAYRNDYDCDKDGFDIDQECNDDNAAILPNDDPDAWYDCVDSDCDGNDGDQDGDGFTPDVVYDSSTGAELRNYADSNSPVYCNPASFSGHQGAGDCADDPNDVPPTLPGFAALDAVDIHTQATEVFYDGVDGDCDGQSDFDQDGDGQDSSEDAQDAGGTVFGQDCDDSDSLVKTGTIERCDTEYDDNCDGTPNDPGGLNCFNYYTDNDGDGHGQGSSTCRCEPFLNFTSDVADDCDDTDATIYPERTENNFVAGPHQEAPEICDGQDNNCDRVTNGADGIPLDEVDNDGDATVECALDAGGWDGTSAVTAWEDCDDTDSTIHPAAPEICDGQDNDCTRTSSDDGIPSDEEDDDGDATVECVLDSGGWDGTSAVIRWEDCNDADPLTRPDIATNEGSNSVFCMTDSDGDFYGDIGASGGGVAGTDCVDSDPSIYPTAPELCDGLDNDCTRTGSSDGVPLNEVDNDGDATVECPEDSGGWDGTSAVTAFNDCVDTDPTIHPAAPEICDGLDNDCSGGTTAVPTNEIDNDTDGYVECTIDTSGGWDGDITSGFSVMLGDDCDDAHSRTHPNAGHLDGAGCMRDDDEDNRGSVTAPSGPGGVPGTDCMDTDDTVNIDSPELCDGLDNDCSGGGTVLPTDETDDDSDGYVECSIDSNAWDGSVTTPFSVMLGDDCDDSDATENPGASEICDGQANNCDGSIPSDEVDDDGDGYVECTLNGGWDGAGTKLGDDCDDFDATENPGASEICDGQANNCDGSIPSNEVDHDNDGYVECTLNGAWDGAGTKLGDDCDPNDATENPGASEICDGQDNDCNGSIPAEEGDDDNDGFVECTLNGGWDGAGNKLGDDCNDDPNNNGLTINPNATELCDGLINNCSLSSLPVDEVDDDGDGYVECSIDSGGWDTSPTKQGDDCNDAEPTIYANAPEICDGQVNICGASLPGNEIDDDGDGYVECTLNGLWDGSGSKLGGDCDDGHNRTFPGIASIDSTTACMRDVDNDEYGDDATGQVYTAGSDCDDTDATVKPTATELCDGQVNLCGTSLSGNEVDNDGDGYVECTMDSGGWDGSGNIQGDDCNDVLANNGDTIFPGATELCDGLINNCDTSSMPGNEVDNDSDGYVECSIDSNGWDGSVTTPFSVMLGEDCNDVNAAINPGATEECDDSNTDEDCNNVADDDDTSPTGTTTWYTDADGDGYGLAGTATQACDDTATTSATNNDCDDTSAAVNPGETEVCDTLGVVDEDCNSLVDDADPGVTGTTTWYTDSDGDGEGDENDSGTALCVQPSSTVTNSDDCDDSDGSINTGATETANEEDDDCNDLVDDGFRSSGDLLVSEIMGNPNGFSSDITEGQWFEVYNPHATTDFHMGGVEVFTNCDGAGGNSVNDSFFIPVDGLVVGPQDYVVFCNSASAAAGACDYIFGSDLHDSTSLGASYHDDFDIQTSSTCRISLYFDSQNTTLDSVKPRNGTQGWQITEDGVAYCLDPATLTASENDTGSNWGYPEATEIYEDNTGTDNDNYGTPGTAATTCGLTAP